MKLRQSILVVFIFLVSVSLIAESKFVGNALVEQYWADWLWWVYVVMVLLGILGVSIAGYLFGQWYHPIKVTKNKEEKNVKP